MAKELRIGYVPEHFATPLVFAQKHHGLEGDLRAFPSGTGHMIQELQADNIDIAIGLTEGWIAGLARLKEKAKYKIVGSYVSTPLCWGISASHYGELKVDDLKGKKIGISRIGSGSYVMSFVLADQKGWLDGLKPGESPFEFVELGVFDQLRTGVNDRTIDAFMWEHFTTKKWWDNKEITRIGEIYTPWASWKIVANNPSDPAVADTLNKINKGVAHFRDNQEEAVDTIALKFNYNEDDAREWLNTVEFTEDARDVGKADIEKTIQILGKAGVLDPSQNSADAMIHSVKA